MQYLLLALVCLPGNDCLRMHSEIIYFTEESCIQERKAIYLELSDLIEKNDLVISMNCESSIPIPRPHFL